MAGPESGSLADLAAQRIGRVLADRWRIDAVIGVGGMAAVYRAEAPDGRRAAAKILHAEFASNEALRRRFLREAHLTQSVDHPARVEVLEEGETDRGEPWFIMELLEGETLNRLWARSGKRVAVAWALEVADRVLDLLSACHEKGIIHRDLKPSNLFLTSTGHVKVLDFGVARLAEPDADPTMGGTALGTPAFMSPEQAMGTREALDPRADIFSVGAVLYTLITGERLHRGKTEQQTYVFAATQPAPSIARLAPTLPAEVVALVDRALAWDRRDRFQDATSMREEIARVLSKLESGALVASSDAASESSLLEADDEDAPVEGDEAADEVATALKDLFERLERALAAVRQYGPAHPEAHRHHSQMVEVVSATLERHPNDVSWSVTPHAFERGSVTVWEPVHPFDQIPYNLFASGFRWLRLAPGIDEAEVRSLLSLLLLDPARDLPPEDDLATAFWEKRLEHVERRVTSSFLAIATGDDTEYGDLERAARVEVGIESAASTADASVVPRRRRRVERLSLEARAAAIAALAQARHAARSWHALALHDDVMTDLARRLDVTESEWSERFVDVMADAAAEAMAAGDIDVAAEPFRAAAIDAIASRSLGAFFGRLLPVCAALEARGAGTAAKLMLAVFDEATLAIVLRDVTRPIVREGDEAAIAATASALESLLGVLPATQFDLVLAAAARAEIDAVRVPLFAFLAKHSVGQEAKVGELLGTVDLPRGKAILAILSSMTTPEARDALRAAEGNRSAELRVAAIAMRAASSAEGLRSELGRLSVDVDPEVRLAALRTMARYRVIEAGPQLVLHIQSDAFHRLPRDERKLALDTLHGLSPARAEMVAIELCSRRPMISRESSDDTRVVAAELLGRIASSTAALDALREATRRWWNAEAVREAAASAAAAVTERRAQPTPLSPPAGLA